MRAIDLIHAVPVLEPQSTTSALETDVVGLKEYHSIKFLVMVGAIAADVTITVEECDDTTPTSDTAIAFKYRKSAAIGTDTMGSWATAEDTGVVLDDASDDDKMVEILVDGAELSADRPYVRVVLTPGGASACLVAVVAVLEPRYAQAVNPSAVD